MDEFYHDTYGCTASIHPCRNGQYRLRVSNPYGDRFILKYYSSYRSAKIAMGRYSEGMMKLKKKDAN